MKRICTLCARGGSKGLPGKNLRPLLGRPLIQHSIEQALASGLFEVIAVSSDSADILAAAAAAGAQMLVQRPDELANDHSPKIPAIVHCLTTVEQRLGTIFDQLVDLDVTSPLRLASDIEGAIGLLESTGATNVITGSRARRSPYFNLVERRPDGSVGLAKTTTPPVTRRQDAPDCFDMNASIYVWRRDTLVNDPRVFYADTQLFEMPDDRSIDIDSALDFDIVRMILERRQGAAAQHA
jgi:N-acylneuraminate cytidylyltransferase/CMP-N,N'-diacetyllegionaminic acid synthase